MKQAQKCFANLDIIVSRRCEGYAFGNRSIERKSCETKRKRLKLENEVIEGWTEQQEENKRWAGCVCCYEREACGCDRTDADDCG